MNKPSCKILRREQDLLEWEKIESSIFIKYIIKCFKKGRMKAFYDTFNGINLLILDFLFKFKLR